MSISRLRDVFLVAVFNCSPASEIVVSCKTKFLTKFSKIDNNGLCSLFRDVALCELRGV